MNKNKSNISERFHFIFPIHVQMDELEFIYEQAIKGQSENLPIEYFIFSRRVDQEFDLEESERKPFLNDLEWIHRLQKGKFIDGSKIPTFRIRSKEEHLKNIQKQKWNFIDFSLRFLKDDDPGSFDQFIQNHRNEFSDLELQLIFNTILFWGSEKCFKHFFFEESISSVSFDFLSSEIPILDEPFNFYPALFHGSNSEIFNILCQKNVIEKQSLIENAIKFHQNSILERFLKGSDGIEINENLLRIAIESFNIPALKILLELFNPGVQNEKSSETFEKLLENQNETNSISEVRIENSQEIQTQGLSVSFHSSLPETFENLFEKSSEIQNKKLKRIKISGELFGIHSKIIDCLSDEFQFDYSPMVLQYLEFETFTKILNDFDEVRPSEIISALTLEEYEKTERTVYHSLKITRTALDKAIIQSGQMKPKEIYKKFKFILKTKRNELLFDSFDSFRWFFDEIGENVYHFQFLNDLIRFFSTESLSFASLETFRNSSEKSKGIPEKIIQDAFESFQKYCHYYDHNSSEMFNKRFKILIKTLLKFGYHPEKEELKIILKFF